MPGLWGAERPFLGSLAGCGGAEEKCRKGINRIEPQGRAACGWGPEPEAGLH